MTPEYETLLQQNQLMRPSGLSITLPLSTAPLRQAASHQIASSAKADPPTAGLAAEPPPQACRAPGSCRAGRRFAPPRRAPRERPQAAPQDASPALRLRGARRPSAVARAPGPACPAPRRVASRCAQAHVDRRRACAARTPQSPPRPPPPPPRIPPPTTTPTATEAAAAVAAAAAATTCAFGLWFHRHRRPVPLRTSPAPHPPAPQSSRCRRRR